MSKDTDNKQKFDWLNLAIAILALAIPGAIAFTKLNERLNSHLKFGSHPSMAEFSLAVTNALHQLEEFSNVATNAIPTGTIVATWRTNAPPGWLMCDDSEIPVEPQYQALISLLGQVKTPDLRGMFLRGWDPSGKIDIGRKGDEFGKPQSASSSEHYHYLFVDESVTGDREIAESTTVARKLDRSDNLGTVASYQLSYPEPSTKPPTVGRSSNHGGKENRPINVAVNFIIKY